MLTNANNCNIYDGTFINVEGNFNNHQCNAKDLDIAHLQEALSILSSEISILRSRDIESKQELLYHKIIRWLSPLQFRQRQRDIFARRVKNTGEWLLDSEEYKAWQNGSTPRVLWCPGKPGAGKTILSSIVINHLQSLTRDTGAALMFIFCDYKERREQTHANLITSLLSQLLQERCERMWDSQDRFVVSEHVMKLYEKHTATNTRPSNEEFLEMLRIEIVKSYPSAFIVLDALDEGPEDEGTQNNLVSDLRNLGATVRLLVTSRDLPSIARLMDGVPRLQIQARDDDIQKYIESQLSTIPRLWRLLEGNPELRNILIPTLKSNCSGMFLVVKLHMDALAKQNNVSAIRNALLNLPQGFDAIYDDIINRIRAQAEPDKHLAETALTWVAYGCRPLSVTELRYALSENKEPSSLPDLEIIVSACAGIVVVDESSQNVRFIHQTVQEYFDRNQASRFPLIHDELARKCIEYLSATCSKGPCRKRTNLLDHMEQHPLLDYAANNWGWHVRASKDQETMLAMAVDLMQNTPVFEAASQILLRKERIHRWIGYSMWHATTYFDLDAVALHLLKRGILPDAEGVHEHVILYAMQRRIGGVFKALIQHKSGINIKDIDGRTPLSHAVVRETGHETVRLLLTQQYIDINSKDKNRRTPFSYAVVGGSVEIVELLLAQEDIDIKSKDKDGRTPFSYAVEQGRVEIVTLLLAREDIEIKSKDKNGRTPFSYAVELGGTRSVEIVTLLLARKDVDINLKDNHGRTPFSHAVEGGSDEIVELLLARKDVHINLKDNYGRTPFSYAIERGNVEILKLLLAREDFATADINSKCSYGQPSFSYTIERENVEIVKLLLAQENVDVNSTGSYGRTPFSCAVEQESVEIVKLLLAQKNVDINSMGNCGRTPFSYAVERGNVEIVKLLLAREDFDINSNLGTGYGYTNFSYAISKGSVEIVELLLVREVVDINLKDKNGRTPFSYAIGRGSVEIVELLLAREDVDINLKDMNHDGRTHFSYAVEGGSVEIVKLLLAREDADMNLKDGTGRTPFSYAVVGGSVEIVTLLLAREDVNINLKDNDGRTPFSYAVETESVEVVKLLLAREDVDINLKDNDGRTPFAYAVMTDCVEMVEVLLARGDVDIHSNLDKDWETPFSFAIKNGSVGVVGLLLERQDVDINSAGDGDGGTPFSYAISRWRGSVDIVNMLLRREDFDVNLKNKYGRTALWHAIKHYRRPELAQVGLLIGSPDKSREILELLLSHPKIKVDIRDKLGRTPLSDAAANGHFKAVELLLGHGAAANTRDYFGLTPRLRAQYHLRGKAKRQVLSLLDAFR